jgi:hypothetical protein
MVSSGAALDPAVMLAVGVHAQPGVYTLLLGSGVSTGAGIPTGWGVVKELVRRAAAVLEPADEEAADRAAADPEAWWAAHGDGQPLGYSNLLAALATEPAARRGLLAGFFEPSGDDAEAGLKVPGPAHRAIATLAKGDLIRVIVTTNFDRLVERALAEANVPYQVVSRPEAVTGLTPLPHASVTVIKLHGDYAELDMRNTVEELGTYPAEWDRLLDRVFDEYGLVVSGWSADWDGALVAALERRQSRRYPFYWDSRSSRGETARRLLHQHGITVVPAKSADELFTGLVQRVEALARLAEPPLTTAMAVARLKRYLPDPVRRIDLHDLVTEAVAKASEKIRAQPVHRENIRGQDVQDVLAAHAAAVEPVLHLVTTGVYFDRDRVHTDLWVEVVQRLLLARAVVRGGPYQAVLDNARHYPALLAVRAAGLVAVHLDRDDVLLRLLVEPTWREPLHNRQVEPAFAVLHDYRVIEPDDVNQLPRWSGTGWQYPTSHLLRADLREVLRPLIAEDDQYVQASNRYEYRVALLQHRRQDITGSYGGAPGEFVGDYRWVGDVEPLMEADFRSAAEKSDHRWPWWSVLGGNDPAALDAALTDFREHLNEIRRHRPR